MDEYLNHVENLEQNDLGADAHGEGSVTDGTNTINYRYQEVHDHSERKILLKITGQRGGIEIEPHSRRYDISPNPHDNPRYEGQERLFYETLAEQAMTKVLNDQNWPGSMNVRMRRFGGPYTLHLD